MSSSCWNAGAGGVDETLRGLSALPASPYRVCDNEGRELPWAQLTQQDLQREFHQARQNVSHPHRLPTLALSKDSPSAGLPGIRQALDATHHLLEMHRRQLSDEKTRRKLQRLDKRLLTVASQLEKMYTEAK